MAKYKWFLIGLLALAIGVVILTNSCVKKAHAEEVNIPDLLTKIPAVNQAVIFSFDENKFDYASTITVASFLKEKVALDFGWTPRQELIAAISFKLIEVKDYIKFPILKYVVVEPFAYYGLKRLGVTHAQNESDYGLGVKLLSVKF